jgi:uncharacterized protein (TIGR01244 family)
MRSKNRYGPVAALLVLATMTPGTAQIRGDITSMHVEGIENYASYVGNQTFAGGRVGFGGATQPAAMRWLKQQGYASVISLQGAAEDGAQTSETREAAAKVGLKYIHLPFDPNDPAPGIKEDFLHAAADVDNRPVYIHCGSGTRAAMFWMLGRVQVDGLNMTAAEVEGRIIAEKPDEAVAYITKLLYLD